MKKVIALLVTILTVIAIAITPIASAQSAPPMKYVVMGDSIAFGDGVYNSEEAVYGRYVADTLSWDYTNIGVNGFTSAQLVEHLKRSENIEAVRKADVISISIGGNDFLQQNIPLLIALAAVGDYHHLDNIQADLYTNLTTVVAMIREVNPAAIILLQTLYNTHVGVLGAVYDLAIPRVSAVVTEYQAANPENCYVVDVAKKFEGHPEYVAVDTIHPTSLGNVALAEAVLEKLCELGLSDTATPVVNTKGIDEIPGATVIFGRILDLFRKLIAMLRGSAV